MSCSPGKCVSDNHKLKKKEKEKNKDKPEKTERSEKSDKNEKTEKPEKTERSEKLERIETSENTENDEKSEKTDSRFGSEDLEEEKIIRPRFAKELWMQLLSREETEKVVGDIIEYQIQRVMAGNLLIDVKRQCENYTAYWVRDYILKKVTLDLTCRDEGEGPDESTKTEDSELEPSTIDTWALRCVPADQITTISEPVGEKEADADQVKTQSVTKRPPRVQSLRPPEAKTAAPIEPSIFHLKKKQSTLETKRFSRKSLSLPSASGIKTDMEDIKPTGSVITVQAASLHQKKPVNKLDPSSFPQHWIVPQFEISDPPCTKPGHKAKRGLSRFFNKNK